jgi:hypothetical protein
MFGRSKAQQQQREEEAERLATNFEQYFKTKWDGVFERPDVDQKWQIEFRDHVILAARIAISLAAKSGNK